MTYQQERDQFLAQFARTFPTTPITVAASFLRLSTTLHRLAEAQCNGDWPCDNGQRPVKFCPLCEGGYVRSAIQGGPLAKLAHALAGDRGNGHPKACPDCRAMAQAHSLVKRHIPTYKAIGYGDPRGCVLWLYPASASHADIESGRARSAGLAVPGRY